MDERLVLMLSGPRRILRQVVISAWMKAGETVGDGGLFLVEYLLRLLRVVVLLNLWRALLPARGPTSGLTLAQVLTYTVVGEAIAPLTLCRTWLESSFWTGLITTRFTRPMGIFLQFSAEMCGPLALGVVLFSAPLLALAPALGVRPAPASPVAGLLFLASLVLAVAVSLSTEYIFAGAAVAFSVHPYAVNTMRAAIWAVLSGAFIPLALLPWNLGRVFGLLPFAATVSTPIRVYIGSGAPLPLMAVQAAWAAVLWPTALWLWRATREKMVGFGS